MTSVQYSLSDRYSNAFVNDVFKDNILLTLAYLRGQAEIGEPVQWRLVRTPFKYAFTLRPGETFAFHDQVLPEFRGKIAVTTRAHFGADEGFRSDGYLVGDGVCHLASFLNVTAREADLAVVAPTRHDFAKIPDVSREYGTSIYVDSGNPSGSARQNLYITNNQAEDVTFTFVYDGTNLQISVSEQPPALLPLQLPGSPVV